MGRRSCRKSGLLILRLLYDNPKHRIKFSIKPNKKFPMSKSMKKYFQEVEKAIAEEINKLDIDKFNTSMWMISPDGIKPINEKDFYKD